MPAEYPVMDMNIEIYSRSNMERRLQEGPLPNAAVISFYDPPSHRTPKEYTPLDYSGACAAVFPVGVHDIDIEVLPQFGLTFETYFPEADRLAAFIQEAAAQGLDILCQCEYGQSRSAACAAAIREFFFKDGIRIFADYRYYPNQLIFNKLLSALEAHR